MFKVNDKVYTVADGWGTVIDIDYSKGSHPLYVEFTKGDADTFDMDGRSDKNERRTLFFAAIPIPHEALVRPVKYKMAEIIMISDASDFDMLNFHPRAFGGINEDGEVTYMSAFESGKRLKPETHMSLCEFDEKFNG